MNETITVWVGASIIYLYGTVNGTAATFTLVGDGYWQATVPRSVDNNYSLYLEAYSTDGLEGAYAYTLYYGIIPIIIDRTAGDVRNRTSKGIYKYTDLNRVAHNVEYLAGLLNGYGYSVTVTPKTDWAQEDIPTFAQMADYLADVVTIKAAFYGTQTIPSTMDHIDYEDANNIEKLLLEIETNINNMIAGFRKCGTQKCGTEVIL